MFNGKCGDESVKTRGGGTAIREYISSGRRDKVDMVAGEEHVADQRFLREVHHRVKNNLQVVCSLLRLEGRRLVDRETLAVFNLKSRRLITRLVKVFDIECSEDLFLPCRNL